MNTLFFGDNLQILRDHVPSESVDLIYLDPPFNSSRNFNLLFKQVKGDPSPAQIMAFEDTWTWSPLLYDEFKRETRNSRLLELVDALYQILGGSEMMAYVLMMTPRLQELHRVLKPTGSLFLHCDPVASHYLKIILDVTFGPTNFRNEIVWRRSDAHNDAKKQFGRVSDRLLFYSKSDLAPFNPQYAGFQDQTLRDWYQYLEFPDGTVRRMTKEERETQIIPAEARRFNTDNLRSPNPRPNLTYDYKGYKPHRNGWAVSLPKMEELDREGLLLFPSSLDGRIMRKRYLEEQKGAVMGDVWSDISMLRGAGNESRGYPTQKPLALLERVLAASSKEGDVVLDPFAGCGTAVIQAERMKRKWIGIDVTWLAISEIIYRLKSETTAEREKDYRVIGSPTDEDSARALFESTKSQNHKPFEMWAVSLVEGEPQEKKGGDKGVDGRIPIYDMQGKLHFALIQVKGGHLTPSLIRDFGHVIGRDKALFGLFICLEKPTPGMYREAQELGVVEGFGTRRIPRMQLMTVRELLEEKKRFELPEGYIPSKQQGVGKQKAIQPTFDFNAVEE